MAAGEKWMRTFCGFCHTNCGMKVLVRDGRIEGVRGDPEHPASRGYLCPKGAAARDVVYSPGRLLHPLRRRGNGYERISWDDALDCVATKMLEIKTKYGPEAVVQVRGAPTTTEVRDGFVQLMAAFGSPNATGPSHLCSTPRRVGQVLVLGDRTVPDFESAQCILIWGANPTESRNYGEGFIPERFSTILPRARHRGAKVIVVDPRRTELAASADEWVGLAVETDLAFGLALLHVIIDEGLYDREFVEEWTVGFDRLADHVRQLTPEWAETITEVPAEKIRQIGRLYATSRPALILDGNGLDQHPNVVETLRVVTMIEAITGNIDAPGGNVVAPPPPTAPYPTVRTPKKHLAFGATPLFPRVPMPYVFDALSDGGPHAPRALLTHHANPLLVNADQGRVRETLGRLEFLVAYDILHSATAAMADIVLPAASDFERYAYGVWPGFHGGYAALQRKVIEPVGEARSVFDVEYELAKRLGIADRFPWTTNEEWIDYKLKPLGLGSEQLKREQIVYVTPGVEYYKYRKDGFHTESGKVELYSQKLRNLGQDPMPVHRQFQEDGDLRQKYPMVATTRRPGHYVHTRFRDVASLRGKQPDPLVRLHPDEAQTRQIADGDLCLVESPQGAISLRALVTGEVRPGLAVVDFGWGNPWDGGPNVNVLTSDSSRCPISGATPNRRFRCQIRKASSDTTAAART